jgi:5-methyltetrahydropteroyltriglutamate--homocysteine methyltransferase
MLTVTKDRPLATTTAGGLPRPSWFTANLAGRPFSVAMADRAYREQYQDTIASYVVDQCRAGIDILVDGDARLDDGFAGRHWISYVEERMAGMSPPEIRDYPIHRGKKPGEIMYEVMEARMPCTVTGHVHRNRLEYDHVWRTCQAMTDRPVKLGGISAQLVEASLNNTFYRDRRELVMDLSGALNDEYHALADAGCPVIQVEEPCIHGIAGTVKDAMLSPEFYVEAFNREVRGVRAKTELWCHTCWGSPAAQRTRDRGFSYAAAIPYLNQLDVDVLMFEAKETEGADLELIGRGVDKSKKIAIGVISHRTLQIERPEEVAALVRKALQYIEPERLILSSDCGFGRQGMSRIHAFYKMVSMVLGANIVRRELGLQPVEVLAADPRYRLIPPG